MLWEGVGGRREDAIGAFGSKTLTESRGMGALSRELLACLSSACSGGK